MNLHEVLMKVNVMRFLSWAEMAKRRGTSISTEKRLEKEDPDYPRKVQLSPGRVGFAEEAAERYDRVLIARQSEGKAA